MAHLYNRILSVIKKPSQERSTDEIRSLLHWFSKKSKLFESMQTEVLIDVLRNCDFAVYNTDQLIIRQGERGDTFYIILSGKVSIYVNTDSVPDDPEEARPSEATPNAPLDRKKLGNFIVQFDTGKTFGELALINKDCIRNASVVADESTDLIVINRDLFNRSLRAPQEYDLQVRENFVKQNELFRSWAPRYRRQAVMSLRREQLQFGMVVVKQGDPVNGLHILCSGQAKVSVDTIQHAHQYANFRFNDGEHRPSSRLFNHGNLTSRQSYAQAESRLQKRNVELCIVGENEVIGDLEQCLGLPTYLHTVVCIQPCEVMILDEENFQRLIAKRSQQTVRLLQVGCETKLRARQDSQIPLLKTLLRHMERQKTVSKLKQAGADFRDPLEVVHQSVNYSVKELNNVMNFLPPRGALVDMYGPGTIFYRNRALRKMKLSEQQREQARMKVNTETTNVRPNVRSQIQSLQKAKSIRHEDNSQAPLDQLLTSRSVPAGRHDGRHGPECAICEQLKSRSAAPSPASTVRSFKDWETSNEYLSELETRMHHWFDFLSLRNKQRFSTQIQLPNVTQLRTDSISLRPANNSPVRLQRFKPVSRRSVMPGVKVVLRRRLSDNAGNGTNAIAEESTLPNLRGKHDALGKTSYSLLTDAILRWDTSKRSSSPPTEGNSEGASVDSSRSVSAVKGKKRSKKAKAVSVDEYNQLKTQMKRKEVDLANFRSKVDMV